MRRQSIIVFSSGKNLRVAHGIEQCLSLERFNVVVWDAFFRKVYGADYSLTKPYALFPFLIKKIPSFDYAVIVAGDDDRVLQNGQADRAVVTTRDNVIFELGLCAMALGEKRVIVVRHHSVRLIDDLRGFDAAATLVDGSASILTSQNVQLKTFDYASLDDIPSIAKRVEEYVENTLEDYSPVVVGAACSTALGYKDNFLVPLVEGLKRNAEVRRYEIRIVLPDENVLIQSPEALVDPRCYIENVFVRDALMSRDVVECKGRPVHFCWRKEADASVVYDFPTTLLASRNVAEQVLSINADDQMERDHLHRLMLKEIDQFAATLRRFLVKDADGVCYATEEDRCMRQCPIGFCSLTDLKGKEKTHYHPRADLW